MSKSADLFRRALSVKELYGSYIIDSISIRQKVFDEFAAPLLNDEGSRTFFNELRSLLTVSDVDDTGSWIRVGKHNDGGYVIRDTRLNDLKAVYSFGIASDVSFESHFAKKINIPVHMYDHTIKGLPEEHPNYRWEKLGICGSSTKDPALMTLKELFERNGHTPGMGDMVLKIDVEGYEWEVFPELDNDILSSFDQIALEFHHMLDPNRRAAILDTLKKINETHCLVHLHGNNATPAYRLEDCNIPDLLEATYLKKSAYKFQKNERFFPTPLDERNVVDYPDLPLGRFN